MDKQTVIETPEHNGHNEQRGPSCKLPAADQPVTRRDFLGLGLNVLGAIALLEVGGAGLFYLQSRSQEGKFGGLITAGAVDISPFSNITMAYSRI